ncbi:dachshund, putative, partial [Ixodes scapularis]
LPPPPPYLSASDSRGSSSPSTHDLPPPLPPAFNAAALCDQFCSVINGFRGLDPLSNARLKSPSSRSVAADATDCRLIQYRGEKIAAFAYRGEYLLCLPQAFELFLRHLVGGLHTVYTKLKRLGISPIVCNVEQVRVLRGLGAIQPGVNRCKLLSCKDFDALYKDCTTARSNITVPPSVSFFFCSFFYGTLVERRIKKKHSERFTIHAKGCSSLRSIIGMNGVKAMLSKAVRGNSDIDRFGSGTQRSAVTFSLPFAALPRRPIPQTTIDDVSFDSGCNTLHSSRKTIRLARISLQQNGPFRSTGTDR